MLAILALSFLLAACGKEDERPKYTGRPRTCNADWEYTLGQDLPQYPPCNPNHYVK